MTAPTAGCLEGELGGALYESARASVTNTTARWASTTEIYFLLVSRG